MEEIKNPIMEKWKDKKFLLVSPEQYQNDVKCLKLAVLTDIAFWAENVEDLMEWCDDNHCEIQGMTVAIPDDRTATLFSLRWS